MAEIVSFTEFQDVYIMTHPTIKSRNQKAQTEWNQIKLKHLTETQIKSKRLPSRQFPDGFHLEAKQLMSNWKRIYGQQKQLNLARLQSKKAHFFNPTANPYFKSKHKKCNAPPSPKRRRKSTHTTSNVPLITRPRTSPSSDEKECIKILKECEELSSKWNMFCDSIEFAQYKDIIHSSEFREYVKRIKHLPVHDTRAWSQLRGTQLFKTLNESSNLEQKILAFAASHEFKVLSQGFACLPVRLSSDVVRVIRTYGGISKHMVMFAAFKGLLKCYEVRKFHQLRPNYIIPEKERVTQSQVIDDIMDVNTSIANCAYLPAHIAAKSLKTLKKKKDELHKTLHRMQKHCISQRAYHDGFTQKVRKAAKLSKVKIYHDKPCRPSVEDLNPSFKATLLSIVEENACADPKRRSKVKSTLKTCDNVRKLLADAGIVLSSSTVYRRFLPSQTNSFYAKKYHTKAHLYDIKLARSQNSSHEFRKSNNGRFLPTMCGVTHQNNGELAYTKSNEHTPQTIRYSSFLESLHYDLPMNLAIDHWNPQFTEQFEKDAQCPNCKYHFNTKTKLKEHVKMRICVHDESKVNESTDGFWLSPSQELSEIEEILDCMPPCSYLVQYKNGETEQITITELSMPANLRAKVQNWQLQPKLKQKICLPMISYDQTALWCQFGVPFDARNDMKSNDLDRIEQKKEHLRKQMIWTALEKQPIMDLPPLLMEQRYHNSSKYDVSLEQKNETMKMFKLKKSKRKPNKNAKKKAKKKKTKPKPKKTKPKPKTKKKKKHSDTESSSDDDEHILANVRLRKRAGTNTKKKKKEEKKHSDTESSSDDDISIHEWRRQQREAAKNKKKNTNTNNNDK
eukprot:48637_1